MGELVARSIIPEEALKAVSASARWSAQRGLEAVQAAVAATKAGHEAAAVHAAVADKAVFPSLGGDGAPDAASRRRAAAGICSGSSLEPRNTCSSSWRPVY